MSGKNGNSLMMSKICLWVIIWLRKPELQDLKSKRVSFQKCQKFTKEVWLD